MRTTFDILKKSFKKIFFRFMSFHFNCFWSEKWPLLKMKVTVFQNYFLFEFRSKLDNRMGTLITVGRLIWYKEERNIHSLQRAFVRLSGIQIVSFAKWKDLMSLMWCSFHLNVFYFIFVVYQLLGVLTACMWYFIPQIYGYWFYLLQVRK